MLSTRQTSADDRSKSVTKYVTNVEIVEFHHHMWNHNEKCIQISTNMPGIGSLIREIAVEVSEIWETKQILLSKTKPRILSVKMFSQNLRLYLLLQYIITAIVAKNINIAVETTPMMT